MQTRLFIIAIIPGITLGLSAYLTDRYDREPMGLLIKVFILGCLSVIPTAVVENILIYFNIFGGLIGIAFQAFIIAGMTEEFMKREVVLRTAYKSPAFDEKLDGIIYSAFSALGFATVENIIYVAFRFTTNPHIGLYRGIFSVPAHTLFAVTMGYYLSMSKYAEDNSTRKYYLRKSWYAPALLHGTFNFILMTSPLYMALFLPFVGYLWIVNLRKLNKFYTESRDLFKINNGGVNKV